MKPLFISFAMGLTLCVSVFSDETAIPGGTSLAIFVGERAGSGSIGMDVTSPYFLFQGQGAIRFSTDVRFKEGVPIDGTVEVMEPYYGCLLGFVRGLPVGNFIRMYGELGAMAVFPTDDIASSLMPHFGVYTHFGGEVFLGNGANIFRKNSSIYLDIGDEVNGSGKARFDRLQGSPMMGSGPSACAGIRYYL